MKKLENRKTLVANWYLDMTLLANYWGEARVYHHTAPISSFYALYEALRLVTEEGLEARWDRHRQMAALLWDGLAELGITLHVPEPHRAAVAVHGLRAGWRGRGGGPPSAVSDYNIEIAGGLGDLKGRAWRVGLMGYSARRENVLLLLAALRKLLA